MRRLLFCLYISAASALRLPASRRDAILSAGILGISQKAAIAAPPGSLGARAEELRTLEARVQESGKVETPEFWHGRLQGQPPPNPEVVFKDAPPIVILPGFGNDQLDYLIPEETSFKAALTRRGAEVSVVPINRPDWLNVARGLSDFAFFTGSAQPEGPAFSWYIKSAKQTVEEAVAARRQQGASDVDARVVLIGHSAGGWLARALCVVAGDAWVLKHVRGMVTLGAPHGTPPPEVADQTRGTIPNVNRRAPEAYYASRGVFYVTASSRHVVGDENGTPSEKNAFTAYSLVLGKGQGVEGDGFVPIESAMLEGAVQLTLDCYHSGGSADPWPKDDWYGSERNVDAWLGAVKEQLARQSM